MLPGQEPHYARRFTAAEIATGANTVNKKTSVDALADHPLGSIVEYPEAAIEYGENIGHIFTVNPDDFIHPKLNIQYSLGEGGLEQNRTCGLFLLDNVTRLPALCTKQHLSCRGLKSCEAFDQKYTHSVAAVSPRAVTPAEEVFMKTLSLFCTLVDKGCAFDAIEDAELISDVLDTSSTSQSDADSDFESDDHPGGASSPKQDCRRRRPKVMHCNGTLKLMTDIYGRPFVQCQYRTRSDTAHLILRNLDHEFDIGYLRALLEDNKVDTLAHETRAMSEGYGPLFPCTFRAPFSAQKELCPHWHRFPDGNLRRGALVKSGRCPTVYDIYVPYNLVTCPRIFIISKNPHSHERPCPVKTPPSLLSVFETLLLSLDWQLADATPRKLLLDSGFMRGLKEYLNWPKDTSCDPNLAHLHPSFVNLDHTRRYITNLRKKKYPLGTGFKGVKMMLEKQTLGSDGMRYLRCVEEHALADGKVFRLIICMSPAMSQHLLAALFISIDTSFKRIKAWQEFEMETWDSNRKKSVVVARAFITSQSAEAHLILFRRIFYFAQFDTGKAPKFFYMHGEGFLTFIADAHKGQALGFGQYLMSLGQILSDAEMCRYDKFARLNSLDAYQHLRRIFRLCFTHHMRNIHDLRPYISREIESAMGSLASTTPLPDFDGTLTIIRGGGRKAKAWLNNKLKNKFVIPAIYQPHSLIPLDIWKAGPQTTNGNEQAHRNVNRDGVNLTLLGGVMRGLQYDSRAMEALKLQDVHSIASRDQESTRFRRFERSVHRQVVVQRRLAHRDPVDKFEPPELLDFSSNTPTISFETFSPVSPPSERDNSTPTEHFGTPASPLQSSLATDKELHVHPSVDYYLSSYSELSGALQAHNSFSSASRISPALFPKPSDFEPANVALPQRHDPHLCASTYSCLTGALG